MRERERERVRERVGALDSNQCPEITVAQVSCLSDITGCADFQIPSSCILAFIRPAVSDLQLVVARLQEKCTKLPNLEAPSCTP